MVRVGALPAIKQVKLNYNNRKKKYVKGKKELKEKTL